MSYLSIDTSFLLGQDIQFIFYGIAANVILGVLVSLIKGNFNFHHLSNFLHEMVLPYLFGYAVLRVVATNVPTYGTAITTTAYIFVILTLLAGIWEKLGHFGLPSPRWLVRGEKA